LVGYTKHAGDNLHIIFKAPNERIESPLLHEFELTPDDGLGGSRLPTFTDRQKPSFYGRL
jgi:hypothetical protein